MRHDIFQQCLRVSFILIFQKLNVVSFLFSLAFKPQGRGPGTARNCCDIKDTTPKLSSFNLFCHSSQTFFNYTSKPSLPVSTFFLSHWTLYITYRLTYTQMFEALAQGL